MGKFLSDETTLRARLLLGILIMLIPLSVLAIGSFITIRGPMSTLERVVYDPVEKLLFLSNVQKLLHKVRSPVHNFVLTRETAERGNIHNLVIEISLTIEEGFDIAASDGRELDLLTTAKHEWINVVAVIDQIVAQSIEFGQLKSISLIEYDQGLESTTTMIDQLQAITLSNIQSQRLSAQRLQWQAVVYGVIIFSFGIVTAIIGAIILYRSVLSPIKSIEQTINRFGQGDLDTRSTVQSDDELGHLASAFNAMAERFKKIQTELDYMSVHDPLTGLFDRTRFHELVEMEMMRAKRYERPYSLLFIDIDSFVAVNERYGHLVGDSVLCSVAMQINSAIRPTDAAARYEDDSFAVVLSETPLAGAMETADRIGMAIAANPLNIGDGKTLQISVSIGMASFPEDGSDVSALFAVAERALVKAKHTHHSSNYSVYHARLK